MYYWNCRRYFIKQAATAHRELAQKLRLAFGNEHDIKAAKLAALVPLFFAQMLTCLRNLAATLL